ncbi:MAG: TetR/AcrR family transcriptional regulator [Alphaproteobacteria bacterium]
MASPPSSDDKKPAPRKAPRTAGASGKRRQDSRRRLLDAARVLFVERGYHKTRPQDLARTADVGHGTFYLHFPDKKACFFAFVDEACCEVDVQIKARLEGLTELEDKVGAVIDSVLDYHSANPGVLAAALSNPGVIDTDTEEKTSRLMVHWARGWAEDLEAHARDGDIWTDYDLEVVGFAIMGMMHQTAQALAATEEGRRRMGTTLRKMIVRALIPSSPVPDPKTKV